mmetsp:Transcript_13562/g.29836  ORF Transcript_13562/g.29836 Transcript_13562/m.29836 type:complete len:205 (+) Transcript_13562:1541-2155(+)
MEEQEKRPGDNGHVVHIPEDVVGLLPIDVASCISDHEGQDYQEDAGEAWHRFEDNLPVAVFLSQWACWPFQELEAHPCDGVTPYPLRICAAQDLIELLRAVSLHTHCGSCAMCQGVCDCSHQHHVASQHVHLLVRVEDMCQEATRLRDYLIQCLEGRSGHGQVEDCCEKCYCHSTASGDIDQDAEVLLNPAIAVEDHVAGVGIR